MKYKKWNRKFVFLNLVLLILDHNGRICTWESNCTHVENIYDVPNPILLILCYHGYVCTWELKCMDIT